MEQAAARMAAIRQAAPDLSRVAGAGGAAATGGAGGASWVDAIVHPQTNFMRRCHCLECGGQKKLASPTAYLYCDYCGALVDFDVRALIRASGSITNPAEYAATMNEVGARSREALAAGDRDAYAQLRRRFYDAWLTATPKAASHRIGDPTYRAALIDYLVAGALATDFDATYQAAAEPVKQGVLRLRRNGMQIEADSFWPLLDAMLQQQEVATALAGAAHVPDLDPDRASTAIRRRIAVSALVQGWMTSLSPEAGEELVQRTGLQGDYKLVEPVSEGESRHCGSCGAEFTSLPGATVVVCDHCGHQLAVGSSEWPCQNCGGHVTMPVGAEETTCPYCRSLITRVGR
jgi:DNA-directed RNA polymerase subunit RPC12/RpoP